MRIPCSAFSAKRLALTLALIAASVALVSGARNTAFSPHDKAFYAPQAIVEYVNPGLVFKHRLGVHCFRRHHQRGL